MNAIYTRQSVDRADSISIESQIEFCKYEMRGEAYKVYTDRGYSGKNTDRTAFKEMMAFVRAEDIVIVESISRIARNTRDLLSIVSDLTEKGVEFGMFSEKTEKALPAEHCKHRYTL